MSLPFEEILQAPALWLLEGSSRDAEGPFRRSIEAGFVARPVRGRKMHDVPGLFDEFAAALQFPYYFGQNWAAFDECLCEIDWLPIGRGIVIVVRDAHELLQDEDDIPLQILVRIIATAIETYAEPIERGESWDRPAVPFHVVLQAEPDEVAALTERWTAAGATLEPLPPAQAHGA